MKYSQTKAMLAITKASLRSIKRSPSAIVFSFVFPFVFIIAFGFIGDGGQRRVYNVALHESADTMNRLYHDLLASGSVRFKKLDSAETQTALRKGSFAGVIRFYAATKDNPLQVELKSSSAANDQWPQLQALINSTIAAINKQLYKNQPTYAQLQFNPVIDVEQTRKYKSIDFILPGQLGFSLMTASVFGVAFMFFNLRNTLVLKRFFATPISRPFIILGESLSRVIFQMITAIVIVAVGYYFFDFTLVNGWVTFLELMVLSFIGLMVFMGFGFAISGLAKNDSSIAPMANLITLPQFLLGGTFFSVEVFPTWLQPISNMLPLTHLNTALRKVAFEGAHIWQVNTELLFLLGWGAIAYVLATKFFKWE